MGELLTGKAGDLKFAAKGIIALIAILLIANFYGLPRKVANAGFETANKATEEIGLNDLISIPKIVSIALGVDDKKELAAYFTLNKDGEKIVKEGDIKVIFSYKQLPDDALRSVCTAYRDQAQEENIKEEEIAHVKGFDCEIHEIHDGSTTTAILNNWIKGVKKPIQGGEYRATVSIRGKGDQNFGEDKQSLVYKFYTEDFVELLNLPISGCEGSFFSNCNVIECKKKMVNNALGTAPADIKVSLKKIMGELDSGNCITYDEVSGKVNFDACDPAGVDEFSKKFSRVLMLKNANEITGTVKSEDGYASQVDKLGDFKSFAIYESLYCSRGPSGQWESSVTPKAAKGSPYGILALKYGWKPVPGESFDKREKDTAKMIDDFLANINKPAIGMLKAESLDNRQLSLSWEIPIGVNKVKEGSYKVSHFHTRWLNKLSDENQKVEFGKSPFVLPVKKDESSVLKSFKTPEDEAQLTGKHDFEVRLFAGAGSTGAELFLAKATTGFFDDAYIETYKGGVDGKCVTKGLGKDPTSLNECDVDAQKRSELKALRTPAGKDERDKVFSALGKAGVDAAKCKYEASGISLHYTLSDKCTPKDVDRIWKYYLIEIGRAGDYDCVLPLSSKAVSVCAVKRQTVNTLLVRGWKDLRVKKGWEVNV